MTTKSPSFLDAVRRLAGVGSVLLAVTPLAAGPWQSLFNGRDLSGWKQLGGAAPYTVEGDAIVGTTVSGTPNSFLATERTYGDFILEFELKQEGATNSGVQIRSQSRPDYQAGRVHGFQCEIDTSARAWTGGLYDEGRRGWFYPVTLNPPASAAYRMGEWNRFRIEAIGTSLRTWVNGMPVAQVVDALDREGFIALQVHSISSNDQAGKRILWRNLRIQTDDLVPSPADGIFIRNTIPNDLSAAEQAQGWRMLWDGRTTAGWRGAGRKEFPEQGWKIDNGELRLLAWKDRPAPKQRAGDIVTTENFGAFELQFEFFLAPGANSGVKYLLDETGGQALGPEFQLLDDERHPDARQGAAGNRLLGSLYDLIPRETMPGGQNIVPGVDAWHHGRIVAHADGRVEHWLNGIKVVDYNRRSRLFAALVERSKYAVNEGFGLAEKGAILLQDHDDEVRFRSIKIRSL